SNGVRSLQFGISEASISKLNDKNMDIDLFVITSLVLCNNDIHICFMICLLVASHL
ncbi:15547_t:CDS:2, partial [Gigaspora margarita]